MIFEEQKKTKGIEVRFENGDLWLTQKAISELYHIDRTLVTKHLKMFLIIINWMKIQYVQFLHILQQMGKNIKLIIII